MLKKLITFSFLLLLMGCSKFPLVIFANRTIQSITVTSGNLVMVIPAHGNSRPVNLASFFRKGIQVRRGSCIANYKAPNIGDRPKKADGTWAREWWPGGSKKYKASIVLTDSSFLKLEIKDTKSRKVQSFQYLGFPLQPDSENCNKT